MWTSRRAGQAAAGFQNTADVGLGTNDLEQLSTGQSDPQANSLVPLLLTRLTVVAGAWQILRDGVRLRRLSMRMVAGSARRISLISPINSSPRQSMANH